MPRKIIPYNPNLKELARKLRNDSTLGEVLLWNEIKIKKLYGYDFQRQKPLLNYIADFYCYELGLVIEIDGMYHYNPEQDELDVLRKKN
ncbi:endonuclease domain-containing protein [Mucilaginibacter sp.]